MFIECAVLEESDLNEEGRVDAFREALHENFPDAKIKVELLGKRERLPLGTSTERLSCGVSVCVMGREMYSPTLKRVCGIALPHTERMEITDEVEALIESL